LYCWAEKTQSVDLSLIIKSVHVILTQETRHESVTHSSMQGANEIVSKSPLLTAPSHKTLLNLDYTGESRTGIPASTGPDSEDTRACTCTCMPDCIVYGGDVHIGDSIV